MYRTTWSILTIVVVLAVVAYFVYLQEPLSPERALRPLDFDVYDVTGFTIQNSTGTIVLKKVDDGWHIMEPVSYSADTLKVARLVANLESTRSDRPLPRGRNSEEELSRAGLGANAARFVLKTRERKIHGVIGKPSRLGTRTVMAVEGRRGFFSIATSVAAVFHESPDCFRDPRALRFEWADWTGIRLESPGFRICLRERAPGCWILVEPFREPVSPRGMDRFRRIFQRLKVTEWLPAGGQDQSKYEWNTVQKRITAYWTCDGHRRNETLLLGVQHGAGKVLARRTTSKVVFAVAEEIVGALFFAAQLDRLRDRAVLRTTGSQIQEVEIVGRAPARVLLVRDRNGWRVREEAGMEGFNENPAGLGEAILSALERECIVKFLTPENPEVSYGLDPGACLIRVRFKGRRGVDGIRVGGKDGRYLYLRREGERTVLAVEKSALEPVLSPFMGSMD